MTRLSITFDPVRGAAYRASGYWNDESLSDWLERNARERPDHAALRLGDAVWSYRRLRDEALAVAQGLSALGIRRGDVVAVQLPNTPQFVLAYLAIASLGAVMQTLHMPYRAADLEGLLRHSGAVAVVCLDATKDYAAADTFLGLRSRLPALREVIAVGDQVPQEARAWRELPDTKAATGLPRLAGEDPFLLLYTSGTTSSPKGVPHAYQDFLSNARLSAADLALGPDDVILSAAPFTHLYGLFTVNMALAVGATIALLPAFSPPGLSDAIRIMRPTAAFTAPAHIAACLNGGLFDGLDMTCLKLVQISGSAVPPALGRALEPRLGGGKVMQLWGMTELQAGAFTRPADPEPVRLESTGRASPGTELRVVDAGGNELSPGGEGELQMRGPSLFAGYLENQQATRDAFADAGWFRTGDLAVIDNAGNVRLTGRVKEIINRGGVKFNPLDVEAMLLKHPAVAEVAVAPIPDAVLGEKACCFVVTRTGRSFTLEEMRNFLASEGVGKVKWPERLELVANMPLTPTRKIIKGELVRQLLARN
jgi:cyclohexanecarboxylate-CoA ligase/acyl-CoA synthetase